MVEIVAGIFATYWITLALTEKDGPWGWFWRLRERFDLFNCFVCMSVWVSLPVALVIGSLNHYSILEVALWVFAFAGMSTVIWMLLDE